MRSALKYLKVSEWKIPIVTSRNMWKRAVSVSFKTIFVIAIANPVVGNTHSGNPRCLIILIYSTIEKCGEVNGLNDRSPGITIGNKFHTHKKKKLRWKKMIRIKRDVQSFKKEKKNRTPLFILTQIIVEKWNLHQSSWIIVYFSLML